MEAGNHIHLKENQGKGHKAFTKFAEGTTDNHQVIRRMIALGYSGFLVVELSPEINSSNVASFHVEDIAKPYQMFSIYESKDG